MSVLGKIILGIVVSVVSLFVFKLYVNNTDSIERVTELPVGSPNTTVHQQGGIIPTTVGFDPNEVQPLPTLIPASASQQMKIMLDNVHDDNYGVFPCHADPSGTNVLMITMKVKLDGESYTTSQAESAVVAWEPYVYSDVGQIIFPEANMPLSPPLVTFNTIGDDGIRRAPVGFAETGGAFIYTGQRINHLFYGGTLQCLEAAMDMVYTLD